MELLNQLVRSLGISEEQAKGGAGLLLNLAKNSLGDDFVKVAEFIPGVQNMLDAAPQGGILEKALGGLTSALGGGAGKAAGLASLAGGFSKLGLDADMIGKFVPVILSFVQERGGDNIKSMLANVLK